MMTAADDPDAAFVVDAPQRPIRVTDELPAPAREEAVSTGANAPERAATEIIWSLKQLGPQWQFVGALLLTAIAMAFLVSFGVASWVTK
jgi:hypothetical protein